MNPMAMLMLLVQLGVCKPVEFQRADGSGSLTVVVCPVERTSPGSGTRPPGVPGEVPGGRPVTPEDRGG